MATLKLGHIEDNIKIKISDGVSKKHGNVHNLIKKLWITPESKLINIISSKIPKSDKYFLFNPQYILSKNPVITLQPNIKHNITDYKVVSNYEFYYYELSKVFPQAFQKNMSVLSYFSKSGLEMVNSLVNRFDWDVINYCYDDFDSKIKLNKKINNIVFNNLDKIKIQKGNYDMLCFFVSLYKIINKVKSMDYMTVSSAINYFNISLLKKTFKYLKNGGKLLIKIFYNIDDFGINIIYYLRSLFKKVYIYYPTIGQVKDIIFLYAEGFTKTKYDDKNIAIQHKNINVPKKSEINKKYDRTNIISFTEKMLTTKINNNKKERRLQKVAKSVPLANKLLLLNEYKYLHDAIEICKKYAFPIKIPYTYLNKQNITHILDIAFANIFEKVTFHNYIYSNFNILNNYMMKKMINKNMKLVDHFEEFKHYIPQIIKESGINTIKQANLMDIGLDKIFVPNIYNLNENNMVKVNIKYVLKNIDYIVSKIASFNSFTIYMPNWITYNIYINVSKKQKKTILTPDNTYIIKSLLLYEIQKYVRAIVSKKYSQHLLVKLKINKNKIKIKYKNAWIKWLDK